MAEFPTRSLKRLKSQTKSGGESIAKRFKTTVKNIKRRNRRKRSKTKYYKSLKKSRINKSTEDLCAAIKVFDVTDMEWVPNHELNSLPIEVSEWQKQDQIAYWKSRALSLEIENRMLHQHLRNVYAKQVEDCMPNRQWTKTIEGNEPKAGPSKRNDEPDKILPNLPEGKRRAEEMRQIYGDKAQKIMGMETAIQLNYERHVESGNVPYWPNLPIRL